MDKCDVLVDDLIEVLKKFYLSRNPLQLESFLQGEQKVLSFIFNSEGDVLPGEIASSLGMTPARVAGVLGALEKKGYILRRTDEKDRRKVIVSITESGSEIVCTGADRLRSCLSQIISIMGNTTSEQLISSLNEFSDASDTLFQQINDLEG